MPADLTEVDGEVAMAANWKRGNPWHRLGKRVEADMSIDEALKLSKSDDDVVPATLYTMNDDGTYEEVEDRIGIKSDRYGTIATASPGYEITQRREMLELAYEIEGLSKGDAHIDTIGNIGVRANKFFAYIRVPDLTLRHVLGIEEVYERGLVVATSFDGTMPNCIGPSTIRPVCANTLDAAMHNPSAQWIKARHTRNAEERMQAAAVALGYVGAVDKLMTERARRMLDVSGKIALTKVLNEFWPVNDDLPHNTKMRRESERLQVEHLYSGDGNSSVSLVGENGYAVFQAVTEFYDHFRNVRADSAGTRRAVNSVMPGTVMNAKAKAADLICSIGASSMN